MKLFEQISQTVGKTVFPIKNTDIYEFAVPDVEKPAQHIFHSPKFENTKFFRIPGAILQEVSIVSNLLFTLPEIDFRSGFEPLSSRVFGTNELTFAHIQISENLIELFHLVKSHTWISGNLFSPLLPPGKNGKEYTQKQEKAQKQHSLFEEVPLANQTNGFQKAYKRIKTPNAISANTTQHLSVWDLIYPILLPPLSLDFVPQFDLPHPLFPYQKTGVSFLMNNESALLGDEMGTGKTVMSVVALRLMFRLGKARRTLIICPVNLLRVWQSHLLEWASELELTVVRGSKSTRELDWKYPAHVYLTTYETVTNDFLTSVKKKVDFNCPNCGVVLVFNDKIHLQEDESLPKFRCPTCKSSMIMCQPKIL